ncbi:MAG: hypothetical protein HYT76_03190 [Deltaproteobacteria bacterium]|nr:hypothetical protein [Deltaproteobacteria bacterium]
MRALGGLEVLGIATIGLSLAVLSLTRDHPPVDSDKDMDSSGSLGPVNYGSGAVDAYSRVATQVLSSTERAKTLHHQLIAISQFSAADREIILDYMDAAQKQSPQQTAFRDILRAWTDIDTGKFESAYTGPIEEGTVRTWSQAYRTIIDAIKDSGVQL